MCKVRLEYLVFGSREINGLEGILYFHFLLPIFCSSILTKCLPVCLFSFLPLLLLVLLPHRKRKRARSRSFLQLPTFRIYKLPTSNIQKLRVSKFPSFQVRQSQIRIQRIGIKIDMKKRGNVRWRIEH